MACGEGQGPKSTEADARPSFPGCCDICGICKLLLIYNLL